jgi:endogenous inhibitor of DNA gyrase (YacG/DUF329 family)
MNSRAKASMSEQQPDSTRRKCAICGKPQDSAFRPFCSKRCADIDLNRWLKEGYAIPGGEPPPDESSNSEEP